MHLRTDNRRHSGRYLGKPGLAYTKYISARGGSNIMQHQALALMTAQQGGSMSGGGQALPRGLVRA